MPRWGWLRGLRRLVVCGRRVLRLSLFLARRRWPTGWRRPNRTARGWGRPL